MSDHSSGASAAAAASLQQSGLEAQRGASLVDFNVAAWFSK